MERGVMSGSGKFITERNLRISWLLAFNNCCKKGAETFVFKVYIFLSCGGKNRKDCSLL